MDTCPVLIHHATTGGLRSTTQSSPPCKLKKLLVLQETKTGKKVLYFFHKLREVRSKKISKSSAPIHEREALSDFSRCLKSILQEKNQRRKKRSGEGVEDRGQCTFMEEMASRENLASEHFFN
eukprot:TRINITY_DN37159_c0_g3_i1.p2 TRINITY_DN37159_c0_g3~~TRINITY_DN37159_c0_g3_i1.p2  ORF type:complete len:123 (+),score=21.83 TRINITY_DN37159_c0_g3_i1:452-820(+)